MRIAQVVTLVSPDGAYGGPLRVAVNQSKALIELGHDVTLFGATRGFDRIPKEVEGVPAKLFKARNLVPGSGFAGLWAGALGRALKRELGSYDVAHVHMARDLITLPSAQIARRLRMPFVVQAHGMLDESTKILARPLDLIFTRPLLRDAACVLCLSDDEMSDVEQVAKSRLQIRKLLNGVPLASEPADIKGSRREVLFLARLHAIKRPHVFVGSSLELRDEFPDVSFALVGPDEGEAEAITRIIAGSDAGGSVTWEGALPPSETLNRMRRAHVYVLPSLDEAFGMTVLEAMSVGVPVIVTESCGLAASVRQAEAGIVIDGSVDDLSSAIRFLLNNPAVGERMGQNGRALVGREYSLASVAARLAETYSTVVHQNQVELRHKDHLFAQRRG